MSTHSNRNVTSSLTFFNIKNRFRNSFKHIYKINSKATYKTAYKKCRLLKMKLMTDTAIAQR